MKLKEVIQQIGAEEAIQRASKIAKELNIDWESSTRFIFNVIANDINRVPDNIGGKKDNEFSVFEKWLKKYQAGKDGRASKRVSNPPGTVADPIVEQIIGARLTNLSLEDLNKITFAHRLGMSAENILGLILEEYLATRLVDYGWHCAWGETVKSVDFAHENGALLQIKNRSNSENSSSSKVRESTEIEKWYRIKADKIEYMWNELNKICGIDHLSEANFVDFVKETIQNNPYSLAVEDLNPWKK